MGYIAPPPPGDDEVIFVDGSGKSYTWGEHRRMEEALKELERSGTDVLEARKRLDATLASNGFIVDDFSPVILICEHCGTKEYLRHDPECQDYYKDLPVTREAGGYKYLDQGLRPIHTTSIPMTDEEALDHFRIVALMFPAEPDVHVTYIMRRPMHEGEYQMLPWRYDVTTGEVSPIESAGA